MLTGPRESARPSSEESVISHARVVPSSSPSVVSCRKPLPCWRRTGAPVHMIEVILSVFILCCCLLWRWRGHSGNARAVVVTELSPHEVLPWFFGVHGSSLHMATRPPCRRIDFFLRIYSEAGRVLPTPHPKTQNKMPNFAIIPASASFASISVGADSYVLFS